MEQITKLPKTNKTKSLQAGEKFWKSGTILAPYRIAKKLSKPKEAKMCQNANQVVNIPMQDGRLEVARPSIKKIQTQLNLNAGSIEQLKTVELANAVKIADKTEEP